MIEYLSSFSVKYKNLIKVLLYSLCGFLSLLLLGKYFLFCFFVFMDYMYNYTKKWIRTGTCTNYILLGAVLFSSQGNFLLALLIIPFFTITRMLHGRLLPKYITDSLTLLMVAVFAHLFNYVPLAVLTAALYMLKYIFDMIFHAFLFGGLHFGNTAYRIIHLCVAYGIMKFLGPVFVYLVH